MARRGETRIGRRFSSASVGQSPKINNGTQKHRDKICQGIAKKGLVGGKISGRLISTGFSKVGRLTRGRRRSSEGWTGGERKIIRIDCVRAVEPGPAYDVFQNAMISLN